MKLTILGMNGPFPAPGGATSGYLVSSGDAAIAMDMGSGILARLTERIAPESLTALMLTHWHYDHCCDVLPLLYRLEACAQTPLHIYAPVDENSLVRKAVQGCKAVVLHDIFPGDTLTIGGVTVSVHNARHPVPAVMLRLTAEGRTLCYTGDTNTVDGLTDFARNADLLLADGLFTNALWAEGKPHLSAELTARLARDACVRTLVITHLNPAIAPETLLAEARALRIDALLARPGEQHTV